MKSGNLNFLEPSGPLQACNGTALPFTLTGWRQQIPPKSLAGLPDYIALPLKATIKISELFFVVLNGHIK